MNIGPNRYTEWFTLDRGQLRLHLDGVDWLATGPHELFGVEADGRRWSARNLRLYEANTSRENGYRQDVLVFAGDGLEVTLTTRGYDDSALLECWPTVRNVGATPVTVTRLD
ncbi:MAG: hypothetical protein NZP34_14450, partial [Caldilineales bacterium]|nr:hypothetical protein [Caldilineales bacterium]